MSTFDLKVTMDLATTDTYLLDFILNIQFNKFIKQNMFSISYDKCLFVIVVDVVVVVT